MTSFRERFSSSPSPSHGNTSLTREEIPTRVLVVDEESLIRWSICAALAAEGYDPVPAADAREARSAAAAWPPPLVAILDSRFAQGDERDVRVIVRGVYPECRFLIMTTDRAGGEPGPGSGDHVQVIQKPFDLGHIVRVVDELAGPQAAER